MSAMFNDSRRITLLARASSSPARSWNVSRKAPNRVIFVDAVSMLNFALDQANHDVDRVLIDGTATPAEYLELLSGLPSEFVGDVLYMRGEGNSFLSTVGRGGCRLLYSLTPSDVEFYLQTFRLLAA
jgi:hypothetical protein